MRFLEGLKMVKAYFDAMLQGQVSCASWPSAAFDRLLDCGIVVLFGYGCTWRGMFTSITLLRWGSNPTVAGSMIAGIFNTYPFRDTTKTSDSNCIWANTVIFFSVEFLLDIHNVSMFYID